MAESKTTDKMSVIQFIDGVEDNAKRRDSKKLISLMKSVTGEKPRMWAGTEMPAPAL